MRDKHGRHMLKTLDIRDFAIIDSLSVSFGPGLNVMTGETGAGKTIIAQAINIMLGARASQDVIRSGSDMASVIASFDTSGISQSIKKEFSLMGIDVSDELVIHRIIGAKGRITINGTPVATGVLKNIAERLVDVSSQHEHQLLLDRQHHAAILDEFGGSGELFEKYLDLHAGYVLLEKEIDQLFQNESTAKEKLDYIKFQIEEIRTAGLKPGEDLAIEAERNRIKHAVELEERTRGAEAALYGDSGSAIEMLDIAAKLAGECVGLDAVANVWLEAIDRARAELEDVARSLAKYADTLNSDRAVLEDLDERLHLVRKIIKKHGGTVDACLQKAIDMEREAASIACYDEVLKEKKALLGEVAAKRKKIAGLLTEARSGASKKLEIAVELELAELGMKRTKFSSPVRQKEEALWDESGPDEVEFLIAPNPGEPLMPLAKIASGGELSRIMLAVKCVIAGNSSVASTSVFDEVDSGIGGAVAETVGKKLRKVSRSRQILCITHLPQVAIWGENHLKISKELREGRTVTKIAELAEAEKVDEIARMLGGSKMTAKTVAHAKEMLDLVNRGGK